MGRIVPDNPADPAMTRCRFLLLFALLAPFAALAQDLAPLARLATPGHALLIRHAYAPGIGDPPQFRIGDCSTQRNLDAQGREEARTAGAALRAAGITNARVLSSEWCRCTETARLLGYGPVETAPALNSFFANPDEGPSRIAATKTLLAQLARDTRPVIMVTHDVTIAGLTGRRLSTAEGVIVRTTAQGIETIGTVKLAR